MPKHTKHITHKIKENADPWKIGALVLLLLLIISVFTNGFSFEKKMSKDDIKNISESYINQLMGGQATVNVLDVTEENGLYKLTLDVGGQEYVSYATKDGKILFPQAMNMTTETDTAAGDNAAPAQQVPQDDVPKSDKPEVELFVMSHCPYGTQSEKGIIPAINALGDSVDFKVRFVYYSMHGEQEVKEESNQYCIQKEQSDKYIPYLECFLQAGDGASCLETVGIDKAKLQSCVEAADAEFEITKNFEDQSTWLNGRYPLFNTDKDLNEKYGVGGSPTLIINGVTSRAGRDSASYLAGICAAFNNPPAACSSELSSTAPSTGFGGGTSAGSDAGCGA